MAAADSREPAQAAAHGTMFFDRLTEVGAARRLKAAVLADQWTERELVEKNKPHQRSRCRTVAGPAR